LIGELEISGRDRAWLSPQEVLAWSRNSTITGTRRSAMRRAQHEQNAWPSGGSVVLGGVLVSIEPGLVCGLASE